MLQILLESAHRAERRTGLAAMSVLAHATLIASSFVLTRRDDAPVVERSRPEQVAWVAPRQPALQRRPSRVMTSVPLAPTLPTLAPPASPNLDPITTLEQQRFASLGVIADGAALANTPPSGMPHDGVHTLAHVDRAVAPRGDNMQPAFPSTLRNAGIEGSVFVRFVVDATGRVESGSIEIVEATHALFGAAVRAWLTRTRYVPALVAGRAVRQLVEQRVEFMLRH